MNVQPAFPTTYAGDAKGLTKREYFASMAMLALISSNRQYGSHQDNLEYLSRDAIDYADTLLKKLNETH